MRFSTKAIRVGQDPEPKFGSVTPPIYQSSTFAWASLDEPPCCEYTRCDNPSRLALEQVIAALENGRYAVVFASGMAAISAALGGLRQGDHMVMASDIYGGTHRLVDVLLPTHGVTYSTFDARQPESLDAVIQPNTKLVMFEGPTNPNLRVVDIAAVAERAKAHGVRTVFDNTFASPYLQNPLDLGVDVVVHSTTKYISGHSDVIGGALITRDPEEHARVYEWAKTVGANPSPFDCWLTLRGVKTLAVRMRQHCTNAQQVAEFLERHPAVGKVHYPGLPSHPDHAVATRQMRGYGGMLAFEVNGSAEDARAVAESTEVFILAESLGGIESLIGYPPKMSHAGLTEEERLERGIPPTLLRVSVGIEDVEDLIADLEQALARVRVAVG